ncbi:MAG: NAD(P)H-hydrate epimerase [Chloroflexi bacterium]|nr:NAD(P)H-hydrate epimerase [Chloroflexota bacterium]
MEEVDRAMVDDFGIPILQMMDQAGRNLAFLAVERFWGGKPSSPNVLIVAGPGGNGGGALSGGGRLLEMGVNVAVTLTSPAGRFTPEASHFLVALEERDVPVEPLDKVDIEMFDLVVDGILGYSLIGDPREPAATLINRINDSLTPVLSNDLPSGIEATSGRVGTPVINADATLTIALPKQGVRELEAMPHVGDLYLGDINVPPELYEQSFPGMGSINPFTQEQVVQIW